MVSKIIRNDTVIAIRLPCDNNHMNLQVEVKQVIISNETLEVMQ